MQNVSYRPEAVNELVSTALNYPYFLQEYGKAIWNVAPSSPFTLKDAELAVAEGTEALDAGFFPNRWERATPGEKRFLVAMAELGTEQIATRDIADHLGATIGSLSNNRKNLTDKGLIFAPEHGIVQFTVPGMAAYISRMEHGTTPES
ncbi:hypothetical protein [Corynebacterium cystitidis]|uniref:Uncharacterized protein n=1 Tax=Corynebacterium cystitidis DSM 20524 TaxID=1121357 RepID=A0A1H9WI28_9CORY|nr:hypothetical protein [Corynebacterium cystitidis]SES33550.1 hypothetical protein SAMN05661109_02748 [Corynebacterium cystitidis DSM 20524]SNV88594.1 Uncharacterised protein [Corynebacterium cystitidis]